VWQYRQIDKDPSIFLKGAANDEGKGAGQNCYAKRCMLLTLGVIPKPEALM